MKIAVIGSRAYTDQSHVWALLDAVHETHPISQIISGGAKGPDTFAEDWAALNNVKTQIFLADWSKHGTSAGFIRNHDIISAASMIIAFWDGVSKGTQHSINLARRQNKQITIIR